MKFKIFTFLVFTFFYSISYSQMLKGRVTDGNTGTSLAGATVSNGNNSTATDKNGFFSLPCSKQAIVTVTYIGYSPAEYRINDCGKQLAVRLYTAGNDLNEVQITATSGRNKSLLYQPVSIAKLTPQEIKRGTGLYLDDAINTNVPGVTLQRRAVSSGQQFNIRGYGNGSRGTRGISSNFDGQGYKVYLNGIPVTDAEGITVLDDIDYGSVGNAEVTKGPAGTLYGLAISGVVNLKTVTPEKGKTSAGQDFMAGNYGLRRYTTRFQSGSDKASVLVNYGKQHSDGFMSHSASKKDFVNFIGEFRPNAKQNISSYLGYSNSYDERSGELTINQYDSGNYTGNVEYIKRNAHSKAVTFRAGIGHTYIFNNRISNTTTAFGTSFNSDASSAGGWTDKNFGNYGIRSAFDTKFSTGKNVQLSGITGIETQAQNTNTVGYTMIKDPSDPNTVWAPGAPYWIIGASTSNLTSKTATTSLFTEWTVSFPKNLSVTAGIGWSNMKIGLDDKFFVAATPNKTRKYDTTYKGMFSPHIAINKVFSRQFTAYAAYSKAYKAPVSSYFFIPYAVGQAQSGIVNANLKPEIGNQFEIGSKGLLANGRLFYQAALFNAIFSHKMTTVAVPYNSTTTLFSYVTNGGKQDNKGLEALVKYTAVESSKGFIKKLSPFANLAWSDFKYKDFTFQTIGKTVSTPVKDSAITTDYSGKNVAGVAKVTFNAGIDMEFAYGIYANITYMYKDRVAITSTNLNYSGSYNLLNAKLGVKKSLSRHFDMNAFFGADNITNTQFPYMIFVNQLPDAYLPAPKYANIYGGLGLQYNF